MNLFCFEGIPGIGKSTFISILKKEINFLLISEIPIEKRSKNGGNPKFTKNLTKSKEDNLFFVNLEIERCKLFETEKIIILERNFISQLAYNYAKDKTYNTNSYLEILLTYEDLIRNKIIITPYFIYLYGNKDLFLKRIKLREKKTNKVDIVTKTSEFKNEKFILSLIEFYDLFALHFENIVLKINTNNNIETNIKIIINKILENNDVNFDCNNYFIKNYEKLRTIFHSISRE